MWRVKLSRAGPGGREAAGEQLKAAGGTCPLSPLPSFNPAWRSPAAQSHAGEWGDGPGPGGKRAGAGAAPQRLPEAFKAGLLQPPGPHEEPQGHEDSAQPSTVREETCPPQFPGPSRVGGPRVAEGSGNTSRPRRSVVSGDPLQPGWAPTHQFCGHCRALKPCESSCKTRATEQGQGQAGSFASPGRDSQHGRGSGGPGWG